MRQIILITAFLFFLSSLTCFAQDDIEKKDYEKTIRMTEEITGRKAGSVAVPDNLKILKDVKPTDGFLYFSGYYRSFHNHPAVYAMGSGKDERLIVIGSNVEKSFPMAEAAKALEFYTQLLSERGYHPQKIDIK